MANHIKEKNDFASKLKAFASILGNYISKDDRWTIRGFIDIFKNVYTISADTKVVSKILELHLFPHFLSFAENNGYQLELAKYQNWYPDLTFISKENSDIKFAVDLKTTYRDDKNSEFCNGFTLGSHGEYFIDRESSKNVQYPYGSYSGHFCVGIIYSRAALDELSETKKYSVDEIENIPAVINHFTFFAQEKWKIASDKGGSGNTANIGSIKNIEDIINGNGVFAKAGEELFDDYWANFGKMQIQKDKRHRKALSSFTEYLKYRKLDADLNNIKKTPKTLTEKISYDE